MKRVNSWVFLLLTAYGISPHVVLAQVGINATGASGHPSSILDISSTSKGFLAPRMTEGQRLAIPAPANGLIVYQTNVKAGYWYYDTNLGGWTSVFIGSEPWTLKGNTGTNPVSQYLGTSNNQHLAFGTNGSEVARFVNTGRFQIGPTASTEQFQVEGGVKVTGAAVANTQGAIQWNATDNVHEGNIDGTAAGWYPLENVFREKDPAQWAQIVSTCSVPPNGYVQIGAGTGTTAGTLETPYGTNWEDHKVQFLWLASELASANLCPNEDITAVAFNAVSGGSFPMNNAQLGMSQTTAPDLSAGLQPGTVNLWSSQAHTNVVSWNQYSFSSGFQWNGTSNLIVEYSFDNCTWQNNTHIRTDATTHHALYGIFCDACGGTGPGSCIVSSCANCPGNPCRCGVVGGNDLDNNTNLITCTNCTAPGGTLGGRAAIKKRAQVRFYTMTGTSQALLFNDAMIYYNGGLMIGDAAWANSGAFGSIPNPLRFQGPGTIVAENSVWGGGNVLNDYVFDIYFDGNVRAEDMPRAVNYSHMPIDQMVNYVERERHLPTIDGREVWDEKGQFSLDQLSNQMWVTVEEQALYIKELNERMLLLQNYLVQKKLEEGN